MRAEGQRASAGNHGGGDLLPKNASSALFQTVPLPLQMQGRN